MDIENIKYRWSFGGDTTLANSLLSLVMNGAKTATTGLFLDNETLGEVGGYAIIYDELSGKNLCVIQYTHIEVRPFLDVDYEYIQKEGEGDKSIESWRESHREFYNTEYPGRFDDYSLVVCEQFRLIKIL